MVKMGKVFHCDSWMCGIVGVHWKGEGEVGLLRVFLTDLFVKYRSWLMEVLSVYTSRCQLFKTPLFFSIEKIFIDLWPIYSFLERLAVVGVLFPFLFLTK